MPTPSAPQNKTQPRATPGTLEFTWAPPVSDGGSPITNYFIELSTTPDFAGLSWFNTVGPSTFYAKVTGLTNGLTYYTRISASNDNETTYGPYAYFRPFQPGSKPGPPGSATVESAGETAALVSWTPGTTPDATIFWYAIISSSSNALDPVKRITANALTQSNYFITDLNPESTYTFAIYSVNCPGWSAPTITNPITLISNGSAYFNNASLNTSFFNLNPGITIGSGDFSVECFFYIPSYPYSFQLTSGEANCLNISLTTAGEVEVTLQGVSTLLFTAPDSLTNKWTHLVVARQSGSTAAWFDGIQVDAPFVDSTNYSGKILTIAGGNTVGYLTNVRIIVGSSPYNPATTFYFTPNGPLTVVPNTKLLLLELSATTLLIDATGTQTVSNPGATAATWSNQSPFNGPGTAVFNKQALSSYFQATPGLLFGTSDFTFEFFFQLYTALTYDFFPLDSAGTSGMKIKITPGPTYTLVISLSDDTGAITYTLPTISLNEWHHVAITRSITDEAVFFDSVRTVEGIQTDGNDYSNYSQTLFFDDNIYATNIRSDVGSIIYPPSYTNIIIPGEPLTVGGYTTMLLLTEKSKNLLKDTSNQQTIQNMNNVKWTYLSPFTGPGSAQFNAANGNSIELNPGITAGTTFTVEFFIWFPVVPTTESFILGSRGPKEGYTNYLYITLYNDIANSVINVGEQGGSTNTFTTDLFTPATWYHIAISNNGGTDETVWVNGIRISAPVADSNTYTGSSILVGYGFPPVALNATITNMRITLGSVVYNPSSSTITVPTTSLNPAGSSLCLLFGNYLAANVDSSGTQTIVSNSSVYCYLSPFTN